MAARDAPLPLPPAELARRVGQAGDDPLEDYEAVGAGLRDAVVRLLAPAFAWDGARVLDFGCGAGRLLRHLATGQTAGAELHGCDIDAVSIAWLQEHLPGAVEAFVCDHEPPLDRPGESFDLVIAMSVFTHLGRTWSDWLLEMHRLLAPGGLLVASFLGRPATEAILGEPWSEERFGMSTVRPGQHFDSGGPIVFHAPWWLQAHWGRAFDILALEPWGVGAPSAEPVGHGVVVARRRDAPPPSRAELEAPEPGEVREISAAAHALRRLGDEMTWLRALVAQEKAAGHQTTATYLDQIAEAEREHARTATWLVAAEAALERRANAYQATSAGSSLP